MPRLANITDRYPDYPDISNLSWWAEFDKADVPNWNTDVSNWDVDIERTKRLEDVAETHPTVRCNTRSTSVPVKSGVPLQEASTSYTKVYEAKEPPKWWPFTKDNIFPNKLVPLPNVVYILSNTDEQWFGIDFKNKKYYEVSACGPTPFNFPWPWRSDSVRIWDLTKDWRLQRGGITGAGLPLLPMVPDPVKLINGTPLTSSIHFVSAGYAPEKVGIATKFDGEHPGHPLRAGERLRLRADSIPICKNIAEITLVNTMLKEGLILTDRTDYRPQAEGGASHAIRLPADPRVLIDLDLKITDFEVLIQQ